MSGRFYILIHTTHILTAGGRFEVDEMSGEVRTVGNDAFMLDQEYVLYVKAEDLNGIKVTGREQSTGEERLSIIGGKRPPQFFMQSYSATIPENKKKDSEWVGVQWLCFVDDLVVVNGFHLNVCLYFLLCFTRARFVFYW